MPKKTVTLSIDQIIENSDIKDLDIGLFANHARFHIGNTEIILDFYRLSPEGAGIESGNYKATLLQRVLIPLSLGKGFATGLANAIASFETGTGKSLPLDRPTQETDEIEIWKQ